MKTGYAVLNNASVLSFRCFSAVAETQSFSSAARQLRIAPSTVTKNVQLLERALAVPLVLRTTRRISMTAAGERFYDQCISVLSQIDAAAAVVAEHNVEGNLRVNAPPSFAAAILGPNVHRFLADNPGLTVDLLVNSAVPDLVRDRIDIAIAIQELPLSKLAHFSLGESPRVICASPKYIESRGAPRAPSELEAHDCVSSRFSELAEAWRFLIDGQWQDISLRPRLLSDNGDLLRQSCIEGAGIGNFYTYHVAGDIDSGRLVKLLPEFEIQPKTVFAIIPHRELVRPQTRAFIEFVRDITSQSLIASQIPAAKAPAKGAGEARSAERR